MSTYPGEPPRPDDQDPAGPPVPPPTGYGSPYAPPAPPYRPVHAPVYAPYGVFTPPPPAHPQANTSMVLGIVGLAGALFTCGLTLFVAPFAWALGHNALREVDASQGRLGGRSQARTGMVTGIIGTILLVIGILVVVLVVVLAVASPDDFGGTNT
jgi:hypothetical protein